jgi:CheY-like chemotaxis protein
LAICRKFVDVLHGGISVTSEVGKGSVFTVTLPVEIVQAADASPAFPARQVLALAPGQPRYRLLIVDDRPNNRQLVRAILQPLGFDLREAENGQECLEMWEEWAPHLIWMDMRMPVMNGYEATKKIRAAEAAEAERMRNSENEPVGGSVKSQIEHRTSKITIIALTASSFEEEHELILAAGCDAVLRKPFRETEMFDLLQQHLGAQFVYAEEGAGANVDANAGLSEADLPAALAALEPEFLKELKYAADTVNMDRVEVLINRVGSEYPAIAAALTALADQFDYEKIAAYINNILEETSA